VILVISDTILFPMAIDTRTWTLVNPVAAGRARNPEPASRAGDGPIRTVAFFSNSKQHAAEIEAAMGAALARRFGIEPRYFAKPNASVAASAKMIQNIATECDAAVVGSGD
jgi:hypothetical protein